MLILWLHSNLLRLESRSHSGDNEAEDPPVPIPNTEVKLCVAESTIRDTVWEDRELPDFKKAQSQPIVVVASFFCNFLSSDGGRETHSQNSPVDYFGVSR